MTNDEYERIVANRQARRAAVDRMVADNWQERLAAEPFYQVADRAVGFPPRGDR
jgi:hypothetical protein